MDHKQTNTAEFSLSVPEAAALLGETERGVHRLIYTARLDAVRARGPRGPEFRLRPAEVLARKTETLAARTPPSPMERVPAGPACCEGGWGRVYRDLFPRYDRLGRHAARLEQENRRLRDRLQEVQARAQPVERTGFPGAGAAAP